MNKTNNLLNNQKYILGNIEKRKVLNIIKLEYNRWKIHFIWWFLWLSILYIPPIYLVFKIYNKNNFYSIVIFIVCIFVVFFIYWINIKKINSRNYKITKIKFSNTFDFKNYIVYNTRKEILLNTDIVDDSDKKDLNSIKNYISKI